ncbi:MAG: nucleotidyltransferase family protein [Deltaproteobacteria bacterium]|nr:nucleotidyltransferase family protein [Deltaproteobacteria bacterium]
MTLEELLKRKKQILDIAKKRGAKNVRVFGSVVRNEAGNKSDVDILVDLEPGRTLFDLGGLLMDLQELLKCPVDIVTSKRLKKDIKEEVLNEAIAL